MKHRVLRSVFNRKMLIFLLLLLQIAALVFIVVAQSLKSWLFGFLLSVIGFIIAVRIIVRRGESAYKFTWLFVVIIFPVFGTLFYLLFNYQSSSKRFSEGVRNSEEHMRKYINLAGSDLETAVKKHPEFSINFRYLEKCSFPVFSGTEAEYLPIGEQMFAELKLALESAEKYIFMEYFIVREGDMWREIFEILKKKAEQGVIVKVMYDDIGSFFGLPKNFRTTLKKHKIECAVFNPFRPFLISMQNNRDHRKITSVDGKIAFTGGINISDEYINKISPFGHWKDSGVKLHGKAAWALTSMFLQMWEFATREKPDYDFFYPYKDTPCTVKGAGFFQPYMDSPTDAEDVGEHVYMQIINNARDYLYITTPYLIIDDKMLGALALAAKSGVDVRIVTPHVADKKFVHATTRSYYMELIEAGVTIYEYTEGFIHAKTFVSDDKIAVVGTTNLDFRSLYLHFECGVVIYDNPVVAAVRDDFNKIISVSEKVSAAQCKAKFFKRIWQAFLRLFAPLM